MTANKEYCRRYLASQQTKSFIDIFQKYNRDAYSVLTTEYPILGMKCGGIGIFIKHLSHLIVKSEAGVKVSVVYWGNKFTETVWDDGISVIPINQPHKSPFSSFINRRYLNKS